MLLNALFIAFWGDIRLRKQNIIEKNNQLGNNNRKLHTYRIHDRVLVNNKEANKYEDPYICPYTITQVWTNGNIVIRQGAVKKRRNIRWIKTYHKRKIQKCANFTHLGRWVQYKYMQSMDSEPNIEQRLGLTKINRNISVWVNIRAMPMTPCQESYSICIHWWTWVCTHSRKYL